MMAPGSPTNAPSPIALIGPGAIGCAVAAALLDAGHDVTVCARTGFDRLIVEHTSGRSEHAPRVLVDPSEVTGPPPQIVFVAVKAHQSDGAHRWLHALDVSPHSTVVVLQNGVDHRARFAEPAPPSTIIPAVVSLPAERSAPGRVVVSGDSRLTLDASTDPEHAQSVAACFDDTFMRVKAVDDWLTPAWTKLMLNAASGGICTLTRTDNRVLADPDARRLAIDAMAEVARVGRAEGAVLADDLPERIVDGLLAVAAGHRSSIVVDRTNGVATEWDARNAVVLRRAAAHDIDVPINHMLTTLIRLGEPPDRQDQQ